MLCTHEKSVWACLQLRPVTHPTRLQLLAGSADLPQTVAHWGMCQLAPHPFALYKATSMLAGPLNPPQGHGCGVPERALPLLLPGLLQAAAVLKLCH